MKRPKTILSWSSGKDSAWALYRMRQQAEHEVVGLLTTISRPQQRVAMHAVREELLDAQAAALGLPLIKVSIPSPCSNEIYEEAMGAAVARMRGEGVTVIAFGDLYLADIRAYREDRLAGSGLTAHFPLWGSDTGQLARTMVDAGLRAYLSCVDPARLDPTFLGRIFDQSLLADLPPAVDPCGEEGEFHSFVFQGPMFDKALAVRRGEVIVRDGFHFIDLKFDEGRDSRDSQRPFQTER